MAISIALLLVLGGGIIRAGGKRQPGIEVRLDNSIPQRVFGPAARIAPGGVLRRFDCGRHETTRAFGEPGWAGA